MSRLVGDQVLIQLYQISSSTLKVIMMSFPNVIDHLTKRREVTRTSKIG